ncbi:hypothetical protein DUNSADRAFT_1424 [Dunaliella salina]|uniref:Uncharacterized protein n=1 Tax=Dunaliella salina TaxID=3046 RepID=A0ABQ7FXH8_DUNSA|nr:hypothetical protein DUNSADRAFT_1424 [Dunaliella salina]|eukprot:KAF5827060.1 hypothetical protein DUNSADRAFT_1424 [Dunaliella salina]
MDTSEGHEAKRKKKQQAPGAVTKVPGLCEVHHTGKRGDRTTAQKKRKSKATAKAVARADRLPVKAEARQNKKQNRRTMKTLY